MSILPLHLDLVGRAVLVVGGGRIAAGKVTHLLHAGADITVVAPALDPILAAEAAAGAVTWHRRPYQDGDLGRSWVVFAATDDPAVNAAVGAAAEAARIFCVRADNGRAGTARTPLVLRQDGLVVGVSSADRDTVDPGRLKRLRSALQRALTPTA